MYTYIYIYYVYIYIYGHVAFNLATWVRKNSPRVHYSGPSLWALVGRLMGPSLGPPWASIGVLMGTYRGPSMGVPLGP